MFEDPLFWVFVLPGLLLGLYAQSRIKLNVTKYSQVATKDGVTGAEVARRLLDAQGLQDVAIEFDSGDFERSLRPPEQDIAAKPVGVFYAERGGGRDRRA